MFRAGWPDRASRTTLRLQLCALFPASLAVLAVAFVFPSVSNATSDVTASPAGDIVRATLPNGLRVVIVRNTLAPVVSTSVNYLVGADETPPGFPGMAHAQEHMMFRGSAGPVGRSAGQHRQHHGRQLQCRYPADRHAVPVHRACRRSGRRAAHRSPAHAGRRRQRQGVGKGARRHRAGGGAGSVEPDLRTFHQASASPCSRAPPTSTMRWARGLPSTKRRRPC